MEISMRAPLLHALLCAVLISPFQSAAAFPPESAAREPDDASPEALEGRYLSNIRQVTFANMGLKESGEGYFSPDGRTIIFQAVPVSKEHYQIYTLNLDFGALKMVSTGRGACTCAYFRPDGRKIIFASSHLDPQLDSEGNPPSGPQGAEGGKRKYTWNKSPYMDIFEADPDGSNLKRLTDAEGYDAEGAYSPDGKRIAFASNRSGSMEIYVMKADGSEVRRLTDTKDVYNGGPFISPDGKRIIYRADPQEKDVLQVFMMDLDGGNKVQLTDEPDAINWAPYWHPKGRTIVFSSSGPHHSNYDLHLLRVDTPTAAGKLQRLRITHHPKPDVLPVFSPDGKKLMWTSRRSDDGSSQLFIADFALPDGF
jgi:Tol biopolymer transport system component